MKFTYTHITKDYTEIIEYKVTKNNKINTNKIRIKSDNINVKNKQIMKVKVENKGFGNTYVVYRVHSNELIARFLNKSDAYEYIFKDIAYA